MRTKSEINKRWREGKGKDYFKKYYIKNRDKIKDKVKEYNIENQESIKEYQKFYRSNNRDKINKGLKNYYQRFPWRKIWRGTMNNALSRLKTIKSNKTINLLGYTYEELKIHLESKFTLEMNWNNYGTYWVVDHIKPISKFEPNTDIKEIHSLNNLQPLEKITNLKKYNNYEK
jgi:5-methylcytosine-specific restriction endonuclease McrA